MQIQSTRPEFFFKVILLCVRLEDRVGKAGRVIHGTAGQQVVLHNCRLPLMHSRHISLLIQNRKKKSIKPLCLCCEKLWTSTLAHQKEKMFVYKTCCTHAVIYDDLYISNSTYRNSSEEGKISFYDRFWDGCVKVIEVYGTRSSSSTYR